MNDYLNFDLSFPWLKFIQEGLMNNSLALSAGLINTANYWLGEKPLTQFTNPVPVAATITGSSPVDLTQQPQRPLLNLDATSTIGSTAGTVGAVLAPAGTAATVAGSGAAATDVETGGEINPALNSPLLNLASDQVMGGISTVGNGVGNAVGIATGNQALGQAIGKVGTTLATKAALGAGKAAIKHIAEVGLKNVTKEGLKGAAKAGVKNAFSLGTGVAKAGNIMGYVGLGADLAGSFLKEKTEYAGRKGNITKGMDAAYDAISTGVSFIPGVGQIIGGSMAVAKLLNKGMNNLGAGTDGMTTTDAVLGSNFFGWNIGAINGAFGSRANTLDHNDWRYNSRVNAMRGSYAGIQGVLDEAREVQGKKYGLFSDSARKSANSAVALANTYRDKLNTIYGQTELGQVRGYDMASINGMGYANAINGGYNQKDVHIGRQGMKLSFDDKNDVEEEFYPDIINWTPKILAFQNGGELNVIPEGALHARKHHMENDDNITKKGIPVVDNDGKQQAEIEVNEIIFRKEVTEKIEQLAKDGSDDAAIECGKLLAEEIIENTDDRTGLIASTIEESDTSNKDNGELVSLKEEDELNNEKVSKKSIGGKLDILRELSEMPAEKLEELSKILKYLNQ